MRAGSAAATHAASACASPRPSRAEPTSALASSYFPSASCFLIAGEEAIHPPRGRTSLCLSFVNRPRFLPWTHEPVLLSFEGDHRTPVKNASSADANK